MSVHIVNLKPHVHFKYFIIGYIYFIYNQGRPPKHVLIEINLTEYFESIDNNFIADGYYNTKHQSYDFRVTDSRDNLLYNYINAKKN